MPAHHLSHYSNAPFDGLNSSSEILAAIDGMAEGAVYEEGTEAYRIWAEPTAEETARVLAEAWSLADPDEDVLHWGCETFRRIR